jgi:hypothetical protein
MLRKQGFVGTAIALGISAAANSTDQQLYPRFGVLAYLCTDIKELCPMTRHAPFSISESLCGLLRHAQDRLSKQALHDGNPASDFDQIRQLLEALPLASAEFCLAVNRLTNAQNYLHSGEYGTARYELRLLLRSLEK